MRGPFLLRTPIGGLEPRRGAVPGELRRAADRAAARGREAAGRHLGRRRERRIRRVPELGLPLPRPHSELPGDGQDAALPRRRRQRPARPFEPARRAPVGGPDLQRPHRAARRAAVLRPGRARRHHRLLPRQQWRRSSATSIARQQIVRQLADSGLNGVLVAPQLAVDAPDSSAGKFWSPGGFAAFLNEAEGKLGDFYPERARRLPAHAGRHRRLQRRLSAGRLFADRRRRRGPGARRRAARRALRREATSS